MTDQLEEAERRLAESAARERALEAQVRAEEQRTMAAAALDAITSPTMLEAQSIDDLMTWKSAAPAEYESMRDRLSRGDLGNRLAKQMADSMAKPTTPLVDGLDAGPLADADLFAALDLAGESRIVPAETLARVSNEQLAQLKRDAGPRGDAFRRSLEAMAVSGHRDTVAWVE